MIGGGAIAAVAMSASAQDLAPELIGYRNIEVRFSDTAADCNLTDAAKFATRLEDDFKEIGFDQTSDAEVSVVLGVSGLKTGLRCVSVAEIAFNVLIPRQNISSSDPRITAALDKFSTIPFTVHEVGVFGSQLLEEPAAGGPSMAAVDGMLSMIGDAVAKFQKQRAN